MNLRKLMFDFLDLLKGGSIKSGISDLENQFSNKFNKTEIKKTSLLRHAERTVPFYKDYHEKPIEDYPIIDKKTMKDNPSDFISSGYSNKLKKLHKATTSGSYGTPFTFYLNPGKRKRMVSEVLFFGESSDFYIGKKHAYLVAKEKPALQQILQNQVMIPVKKLNHEWCEEALEKIKKLRVKVLIGYASAIDRLALHLLGCNDTIQMDGVITISEVLTDEARGRIKAAFLCPPVSRYSTEELGVIGNQHTYGDYFLINQCNYFVEVLSLDSPTSAKLGELGRIIVTDYFNFSMPLIRYDTGDLAKPIEFKNGLVTKIDKVEGRRLAVIKNVDGVAISSFQINGALRESKEILQFQFSQEGLEDYELKLVVKEDVDENTLKLLYQKILGDTAKLHVSYVDDIPPLASGKRPYIIQNYYAEAM